MVEYTKPWLSVDAQTDKLISRGIEVGDRSEATKLLRAVGYYRLTGYLYPFRRSERYESDDGRSRVRVLSEYVPGTSLAHAAKLIDFDRALRMLVMDGVERIEVSLRMEIGYVLGEVPPSRIATRTHSSPRSPKSMRTPRPARRRASIRNGCGEWTAG